MSQGRRSYAPPPKAGALPGCATPRQMHERPVVAGFHAFLNHSNIRSLGNDWVNRSSSVPGSSIISSRPIAAVILVLYSRRPPHVPDVGHADLFTCLF